MKATVMSEESQSRSLSSISKIGGSSAPRPHRAFASELLFLGGIYAGAVVVGSLFISACGPGCCFVFYSILAGISGLLLMLSRHLVSRCICFIVLLLSLFGMWHEKEARDTWGERVLRVQIERLRDELQQRGPK
jgi:hypothetical protein